MRKRCRRLSYVRHGVAAMLFAGLGTAVWAVPPGARPGPAPVAVVGPDSVGFHHQRQQRAESSVRVTTAVGNIGGDTCADATPVSVAVGVPGAPLTTTLAGDTTGATGPECSPSLFMSWWVAFEIDRCALLTIDFCGTDPHLAPNYITLWRQCSPDGSSCSGDVTALDASRSLCPAGDGGNILFFFDALPPGTYYYPVIADENILVNGQGPFTMHITAEECDGLCLGCLGACCDPTDLSCTEGVPQDECGAGQQWTPGGTCCELECGEPGEVYDSLDANLLSRVPVSAFSSNSAAANDVWGFTSPLGHKYAVVGLTRGTGFVRVTDPRNPVVIGDIPDANSTWSDMKRYGDYVYNVNESSGGMQVIDVSGIDQDIVSLSGAVTGGLSRAHNVALNPDSGFVFPVGSNLAGGGLLAYSLTDPSAPLFAGSWGVRYIHDAQIVSYDACPTPGYFRNGQPCEVAFAFCGGSGLYILDVTDKSSMTTLATLLYPTRAYCHQGWVSEDRQYLFFDDELDELHGEVSNTTTYVVDISDLRAPTLVTSFQHSGCWIDHNLHVRGDRLYQAHYSAGLRVTDIGTPATPQEVAHFDTYPGGNPRDFVGAWGVYASPDQRVVLVSDMQSGLFVLCDEPELPIASFTADQNPVAPDTTVNLDGSWSTHCDPEQSIVLFEWDLDYDGGTFDVDATGPTVSGLALTHDVLVALRVTDGLGAEDLTTLPLEFQVDIAAPPPAPDGVLKSRTVSFGAPVSSVAGGGADLAVRLRLKRMYIDTDEDPVNGCPPRTTQPDLGQFEGEVRWLGEPAEFSEDSSPPDPNFLAAATQCCPHYRRWDPAALAAQFGPDADVSVVHAYGTELVPCSVYELQFTPAGCGDLEEEGCYSDPLEVRTGRMGDVWASYGGAGEPAFLDIGRVVDKYKGVPFDPGPPEAGAPPKVRAMLRDNVPPLGTKVNFIDIGLVVESYKHLPYGQPGPTPGACGAPCP
jgi:choice-of-anchor B domain-containing protein